MRRATMRTLLGACALLSACDAAPADADAAYGLGRTPSPARLAALDMDVNPSGTGLPEGGGTAADGAVVYAAKCASCHGANGEGVAPVPPLVGRTPDVGYDFARAERAPRTIGNYWPYATTVFDYVRRAMPLSNPGSLSATETYAVVAWLLHENGIIEANAEMNATTLPAVQMPARGIFVPDDRQGGRPFR
jgi:S-disulfanyl-L-cysteine oxidoreductase SoxD